MSRVQLDGGIQQTPFGNPNTNAPGSFYPGESAGGASEYAWLERSFITTVFDAAPAKYAILTVLFSKSPMEVGLDEFDYMETNFGRDALEIAVTAAAVAAAPNATVSQTITLTADSVNRVAVDDILSYPDDSGKAVVTDVDIPANQITVASYTGRPIPEATAGQFFSVHSTIQGDSMDRVSNNSRQQLVRRYNYVQFFARKCEYGRREWQGIMNNQMINKLELDMQKKVKQLRYDMYASFFNGERGEFILAGGYKAKAMGGIFPTLRDAGAASANPSQAGIQTAFEALAYQTDHTSMGGVRFIHGAPEIVDMLTKSYKASRVEMTMGDREIDLTADVISFGGMRFVVMPESLFNETSIFPNIWKRRLLCLDHDAIQPVKQRGIPLVWMIDHKGRGFGGETYNIDAFKNYIIEGQFSLKINNPLSMFYMDVA